MAKNLQSKLSPSDSIRIFDVNKESMERLAREMLSSKAGGAAVHLAESAADSAKHAVCRPCLLPAPVYDVPLFYP